MVHTRLAAVRSKKHLLPTKHNLNNSNNVNVDNDIDNDASNIVIDNDNIELIVPETQTQFVGATQLGTTGSVHDEDQLPEDYCNLIHNQSSTAKYTSTNKYTIICQT